jgi:hypothetical protein
MELNLSCRTCEFHKNGLCTSHKSEIGYLGRIDRSVEEMKCWSMSLEYFATLVSTLPLKDQKLIRQDEHVTVYELLERVETGAWNSKVLRRWEEAQQPREKSWDIAYDYHPYDCHPFV